MSVWAMMVRWYLRIPDPIGWFHALHAHIAWYVPGMIALGLVPALAVFGYCASHLFHRFAWFSLEEWYRVIAVYGWGVSYYALWTLYIVWLPLPWPRFALLLWAFLGYRRVHHVRWRWKTREKRRRAWQAVREGRLEEISRS